MNKGTLVEVTGGKAPRGVQGTVFWTGPDRYDEGSTRIGIKTDSGETYWLSENDVRAVEAGGAAPKAAAPAQRPTAPPPQAPRTAAPTSAPVGEKLVTAPAGPAGPAPDKGARVSWATGVGTVFWYGPSKFGDGMRVGVEDDNGAKHWLDAREVTVTGQAPARPARAPRPADNPDEAPHDSRDAVIDIGDRPPDLSRPPVWLEEVPPPDDGDAPPPDDEFDWNDPRS